MGQKVNPIGMRLGVSSDWSSKWYAEKKDYAENLQKDIEIRAYIRKKLESASVSKVLIERPAKQAIVTIFSARPGIVIGKKGEDIERLRATLVAQGIAQQLERRIMFRRAMRRAVSNTMRLGALGIKVNVAGRLNGAEIARTEWYREGRVPLHTLRADIDYGTAEGLTTYGIIGIKVWIFKGEIYDFAELSKSSKDDSAKKKSK